MKPDASKWLDPEPYTFIKNAAADAIAWEFLRRNPEYQLDVADAEIASGDPGLNGLRKRWGVHFRGQPRQVSRSPARLLVTRR